MSIIYNKAIDRLFEPPQTDFARKYGEQLAIMCFTGFYCLFYPAGILLTVIGLVFRYWVDKCLLLYRYKKPQPLGEDIAIWSIEHMNYFLLALLVILIIYGFS